MILWFYLVKMPLSVPASFHDKIKIISFYLNANFTVFFIVAFKNKYFFSIKWSYVTSRSLYLCKAI